MQDSTTGLVGTWRLIAAVREELPSGRTSESMGPNPTGYLNYAPDGRMIVVMARSDRRRPAGVLPDAREKQDLFDGILSYAGTYSVQGDEITHRVDISWNEAWTGTEQKRKFRFDGDRMVLSTQVSPDLREGKMSVRTLTWERVK